MASKATVAAMSLATALAGSLLSGPATADNRDDACDTSLLPSAGVMAGTVGGDDSEDWWRQVAVPGVYLVTLTAPDADLSAGDGSCASSCGAVKVVDGVASCRARTGDGWLTVGVQSGSKRPTAYAVTATLLFAATPAECGDRIDNDGDGAIDYPADSGCSSFGDASEDAGGPCVITAAGDVCVHLTAGSFVMSYTVDRPHGSTTLAEANAYLQSFRFNAMGNPVVVTCVVVTAPPSGYLNPCRTAGGNAVGSRKALYSASPAAPDASHLRGYPVRVCEHELSATVAGTPSGPLAKVMAPCDARPIFDE